MRTTVKTFLLIILIGIGFPMMSMATSSFQCTLTWKVGYGVTENPDNKNNPAHRLPSRPILLSIESDGHLSIS